MSKDEGRTNNSKTREKSRMKCLFCLLIQRSWSYANLQHGNTSCIGRSLKHFLLANSIDKANIHAEISSANVVAEHNLHTFHACRSFYTLHFSAVSRQQEWPGIQCCPYKYVKESLHSHFTPSKSHSWLHDVAIHCVKQVKLGCLSSFHLSILANSLALFINEEL